VSYDRLRVWTLALVTLLAGAAVLWLLWHVLRTVAPVVAVLAAGGVLATLLGPLADRIQGMVRSRPLAALMVILLVLVPFVALASVLLTVVLHEAEGLLASLPVELRHANRVVADVQTYLSVHLHIHLDLVGSLSGPAASPAGLAQSLASAGGGVLKTSIGLITSVVTLGVDTILVLVVAFFLIWDGRSIVQTAFGAMPATWQPTARELFGILSRVVAAFFRGQVLVGALFGFMVGFAMFLVGLPYAALLGFLAGLFEMVPTVGPILASLGPILLTLTQPHPNLILVLAILVAAQQVESNILVPRISGRVVGLHPLTVILSVFTGWTLAGLVGALLAVPAAAVGREVVQRWWRPPAVPVTPPRPAATVRLRRLVGGLSRRLTVVHAADLRQTDDAAAGRDGEDEPGRR